MSKRKYGSREEYLAANRERARARYWGGLGPGGESGEQKGGRDEPSEKEREELCREMRKEGERPGKELRGWLRKKAEGELWFLARWILGLGFLGEGKFHRSEVCPFLTDYTQSRFKLLMLPMGHLKTSCASRALPLHMLVQPAEANIYRPGVAGREMRILLGNENERKCKENLGWIREQLESNVWLRWLWPEVVWGDPQKEARVWADDRLVVKRDGIFAEPSITAVGIKTGVIGRYYDAIVADDIAALEAAQNPGLMQRADRWRKSVRTRLVDKRYGIYIGCATHWAQNDVYVAWKQDPSVEVMVRSVVEEHDGVETPLWPEHFPMEVIQELRKSTDGADWQLWYMNNPVSRSAASFRWGELRTFNFDGTTIRFWEEDSVDRIIEQRTQRTLKNLGFVLTRGMVGQLRTKAPRGMSNEYFEYMHEKYPAPEGGPPRDLRHL